MLSRDILRGNAAVGSGSFYSFTSFWWAYVEPTLSHPQPPKCIYTALPGTCLPAPSSCRCQMPCNWRPTWLRWWSVCDRSCWPLVGMGCSGVAGTCWCNLPIAGRAWLGCTTMVLAPVFQAGAQESAKIWPKISSYEAAISELSGQMPLGSCRWWDKRVTGQGSGSQCYKSGMN